MGTREQWEYTMNVRDVENWSIQEVKKKKLQRTVACCLLHSLTHISSSAEYLVSLFNQQRSLGSHKRKGKDVHAIVICK